MSDLIKCFILIMIVLLAYIVASNLIADQSEIPDTFQKYLKTYLGKKIVFAEIPGIYLVKEVHADYLTLEGGITPLPEEKVIPFHSIILVAENKLYVR